MQRSAVRSRVEQSRTDRRRERERGRERVREREGDIARINEIGQCATNVNARIWAARGSKKAAVVSVYSV